MLASSSLYSNGGENKRRKKQSTVYVWNNKNYNNQSLSKEQLENSRLSPINGRKIMNTTTSVKNASVKVEAGTQYSLTE